MEFELDGNKKSSMDKGLVAKQNDHLRQVFPVFCVGVRRSKMISIKFHARMPKESVTREYG